MPERKKTNENRHAHNEARDASRIDLQRLVRHPSNNTKQNMMQILLSFGCGLAFAMGVTSWFFIRDMATVKGREELKREMREHAKRVEDRLAVQVSTMVACLDEIKKRNDA